MNKPNVLDQRWENTYLLAKDYYKENNHLLINSRYVINGVNLGAWISSQRTKYKSGLLCNERKCKLEAIGMIWDVREYNWHKMYNVAKKYYEMYGDLMVPLRYVSHDGEQLGSWISQQRKNYANRGTNKENSLFTEEKIFLLEEIEMVWNASDTIQSTSFPEQCIGYYAEIAGLEFMRRANYCGVEIDVLFAAHKIGVEYDGDYWHKDSSRDLEKNHCCRELGLNLIRIREPNCPTLQDGKNYCLKGYSNYELSLVLHELFLDYFGVDILVDIDQDKDKIIEQYVYYTKQRWKKMIVLLTDYKKKHGHIRVGRNEVIDGYLVGSWVHDLRKRKKEGTLLLSKTQIVQLEALGMIWDLYEDSWDEMFLEARKYYELAGNLQIPETYKTESGRSLLGWVNEQRKKYKKGILSPKQITNLESLSIEWFPIQNRWEYMYHLAECYYKENGNLLIPINYLVEGESLGNWISKQRKKYLRPTQNSGRLKDSQIEMLENIGMVWDVLESQWLEMYVLCEEYRREHGDLRVNRNYESKGKKLGVWIGQQRVRYNRKDGSISDEHIKKLDSLGMVWDENFAKWYDMYEVAKAYYFEFGSINISQNTKYNGRALGKWVYNQKKKLKENMLSRQQRDLLEKIELVYSDK